MQFRPLVLSAILFAVIATAAHAQDGNATGAQPAYGEMPMASHGHDRRLERRLSLQGRPEQDRRRRGPAGILGLDVNVPMFIGSGVNRDVVRPGGGFDLLGGVDFGYFALETNLGFFAARVNASDDVLGLEDDNIKQVQLGFGGRFQFPNDSRLIPYLGARFELQWWKLVQATVPCAEFYCSNSDNFGFAPGLSVRAGTAIAVGERVALDIGVRYFIAFEGQVFDSIRHAIAPTLGVRLWL